MSPRFLLAILRPLGRSSTAPHPDVPLRPISLLRRLQTIRTTAARHASSSSRDKPIVLEPPDKFRPPSHPSKLGARRLPRHFVGPPVPPEEKAMQATRDYPHTFPKKGTKMHWFLTNQMIHVVITLGTLTTLAVVSLTQSFMHTTAFGHLIPSISTLPTAPISFVKGWTSAILMQQDYDTERTQEKRNRGIQDAQKRRLYRRAHGMEDLEEGGEGVDVRGLVSWDDGLSNRERREAMEKARLERGEEVGDEKLGEQVMEEVVQKPRKKLKKWLGIW